MVVVKREGCVVVASLLGVQLDEWMGWMDGWLAHWLVVLDGCMYGWCARTAAFSASAWLCKING